MTENELIFQISNIVNGRASFPQAIEQIAILLERETGVRLLDTFDQQDRSLYSVELLVGDAFPQRLADFVAEQLGMLVAFMRLAERRAQLKSEIAQIEKDLATRKLMQRAEGLLVARRGLTPTAAKRWIAQQSHKTGLSKNDIAERIITYYQATGLLEQQRIA